VVNVGKETRRHIEWLDYARFFAAVAVMLFHYCANGIRSGKISSIDGFGFFGRLAEYGYLGVDFFFIISGFVILYSAANRSADQFAASRLVRLYPAYLFCMSLTAAVITLFGKPPIMPVTLSQYLANLTMFASYIGFKNVDGVYWTLSLEIVFYIAVMLVIFLKKMKNIEMIVAVWIFLMVVLKFVEVDIPLLSGYYSLFAVGCVFSFIYSRGFNPLNAVCLAAAILLSLYNAAERGQEIALERGVVTDGHVEAATTCVFFIVFLLFRNTSVRLPFANTIGSLTYPLYLLHAYIGYTIISAVGLYANKWLVLLLVSVLMIFLSWIVCTFVEKAPRSLWFRIADKTVGTSIRFLDRAFVSALASRRR
jgi:peptidoglycan/LPS O-acetylase OafA/YrhL